MDKPEYSQVKKRCQDILDELNDLEQNQNKQKDIFETYKKGLLNLQNFDKQYVDGDVTAKDSLPV